MSAFKYLVIADDSPECPIALLYAGLRARATGSGLVMLNVVEPASYQHWVSVGEAMRAEAHENAAALCARHAAELAGETGVQAEIVIREGEVRPEIRGVLADDPAIKLMVLAAGAGRDGPGPLVASLAKGGLGGRAIPVLVVPGNLGREDVRMLAGPGPTA
jgi:hypothetical protein